jgi:DNA topoisomerase-1
VEKSLVIVESPAKAKTIEGYLGKDFKVVSSYGHIRDLPKDSTGIDIENGFKPTYEVTDDKKDLIKELKKLVKQHETIYLASDDDREGEAISWHLKEALTLSDSQVKRIVFREITKNAITNAIKNPRTIDLDLVNAQQARRVLDRLVGYELSPILWKKIKTGLSAGRVQSVAVRIVVEREREIDKFNTKSTYRVIAIFDLGKGKNLKAELSERFNTLEEAKKFLETCIDAKFNIKSLEKKPVKKSPAPPFTTSTLQQEASTKLGFSVSQTMTIAQKLYESGKISYMRTDSVNLSEEAIKKASDQIVKEYGKQYLENRTYKTKSESAQEAHEAIRPTDFSANSVSSDRNEQRLYDLIWKRAIASQMSDAKLEKTVATISVSTAKQNFIAEGQVVTFEGFLKVYNIASFDSEDDEEQASMLPPLENGQELKLDNIKSREIFSRPPARYTEASLVKKLEEMGIGRPSTYAPTISTIVKREYVVKESREGKERAYNELTLKDRNISLQKGKEIVGTEKNKLFPTNIGMVVNDFLTEHFDDVVNYSFTANVEKEFDDIASGKKKWNEMIGDFYGGFHSKVEKTANIDRTVLSSARELGVDPKTEKKVIVRLARFGAIAQLGELTETEKPQYAKLKKGQFIESITLEDALDLFQLPKELALYEDKPMVVSEGRFGPYIKHDNKFYSLPKGLEPLDLTEEQAVEIIIAKRKSDAEKLIKAFPENDKVQVLNGRWGPYLKFESQNVKIPKGKDPMSLTFEECVELAEKDESSNKKGKKSSKTTSTAKKATTKTAAAKKTASKTTTKKVATKKDKEEETETKTKAKSTKSKTTATKTKKTTTKATTTKKATTAKKTSTAKK